MSQWYYSDFERNQLGPVGASDLAELHKTGQLQPDTLVWRAGMPQWRPWREVMGQALNEAAGIDSPVQETRPLSEGVNPYAMAEPTPAVAAAGPGTLGPDTPRSHSPYAPPRAVVDVGSGYVAGGEIVYAGFWKRFAAYFIDSILMGIVVWVVQTIILLGAGVGVGFTARNDPASLVAGLGIAGFILALVLLPMALQAVYFAWMHSSERQATLGKMAVGIKVTDDDGQRISFLRGIGRYFATILSSLTLCIGYILAGVTDRKRALHDMVASTLVVDQWAFTSHPERQRRELGTVTTVIIAIGALLVLAYLALFALLIVGVAMSGNH